MRPQSKPSTAKCTCTLYRLFLLAEPKYISCVRLSEVMGALSHDSVNRFLLRENDTPEDLFNDSHFDDGTNTWFQSLRGFWVCWSGALVLDGFTHRDVSIPERVLGLLEQAPIGFP